MRKESRTHHSAAADDMGYLLPEPAHLALVQARDQLRLLACLAEPTADADDAELMVPPLALAQCFARLALDLEGVIDAARWLRSSQ